VGFRRLLACRGVPVTLLTLLLGCLPRWVATASCKEAGAGMTPITPHDDSPDDDEDTDG